MTKYHIGADNIDGKETQYCNDIATALQGCGNQTQVYPTGPNKEGLAQQIGGGKDDVLVFVVGGVAGCTLWSIKECVKSGSCCKTIFAYAGWTSSGDPSSPMSSKEANFNYKIGAEWDSGQYLNDSSRSACESDIGGRTQKEYVDANSQYIGICYSDKDGKDLGEQICQGTCGQGGGSSSGSSGGGGAAVNIVDKTFYGLIKQMIGATDSLFIIANNMAYLISFKDFYEYRDRFDEFIPNLTGSDVLIDGVEKWWSTDGFYNAVQVKYKEGTVKYQNDALVNQYGENVWYYEFPEDDEETAKAKADALLSAHVRDYSQDIRMTIIYNPNVTVGSWIKVPKTITNASGITTPSDQKKKTTKEKEKKQKMNGVTIENIIEIAQELEDGTTKYLQHVTPEEGEAFDIELEKNEYELFFVQGYSIRWTSEKAPLMDIHLKYGPDTPEDPINATIAAGGDSGSNVGGQSATINEFVKKCLGNSAKQDMATVQKLYDCLNQLIVYELYDCSVYSTPDECYKYAAGGGKTQRGIGINCADTSRLVVACYKAAGFQCQVVSCDGHYWNEVMVNGQAQTVDCSSGQTGQHNSHPLGDRLLAGVPKSGQHGDNPSC